MDGDDDAELFFVRNNVQVIINTNAVIAAVASMTTSVPRIVRNDRDFSGREWIMSILQGHPIRCHDSFRMTASNFITLCDEVMQKGFVQTDDVSIEEQVGMFLQILGHSTTMRKIGEDFQRSLETVHRCFKNVLRSVLRMRREYVVLPKTDAPVHPRVSEGSDLSPFKKALGAIDGTFIPCIPPSEEEYKEKWRNRKGFYSQNVLAAVDFDMNFVYVLAGWEGATHDNHVLQGALSRYNFQVPSDRYYLADLGYANTINFITPYRNHLYHLGTFRRRSRANRYRSPEELYNHKHAQLRNIVERAFGQLKDRFKILKLMRPYDYKRQCKIVIACCILHNFIKKHTEQVESDEEDEDEEVYIPDPITAATIDVDATASGTSMREEIRNLFWEHRTNYM